MHIKKTLNLKHEHTYENNLLTKYKVTNYLKILVDISPSISFQNLNVLANNVSEQVLLFKGTIGMNGEKEIVHFIPGGKFLTLRKSLLYNVICA